MDVQYFPIYYLYRPRLSMSDDEVSTIELPEEPVWR